MPSRTSERIRAAALWVAGTRANLLQPLSLTYQPPVDGLISSVLAMRNAIGPGRGNVKYICLFVGRICYLRIEPSICPFWLHCTLEEPGAYASGSFVDRILDIEDVLTDAGSDDLSEAVWC